MKASRPSSEVLKRLLVVFAAILFTGVVILGSIRLITGKSLGLRSVAANWAWTISSKAKSIIGSQAILQKSIGAYTNVVFLHHSVGSNLIDQGAIREKFAAAGYDFWDHDYNWEGLVGPDGKPTGYSYDIPGDNTDPDGLARIFSGRAFGLPLNAISGLLQHEVIIFKSCFPVNQITSDEQLQKYLAYYLEIRAVMDLHPEKLFIVVTPPPLNPVETNPEAAARARQFANWLKSDEFLKGHANISALDLFDLLAEDNPSSPDFNMLRMPYQAGSDSHPNQLANVTVGPIFVEAVIQAIQRYRAVYHSSIQ